MDLRRLTKSDLLLLCDELGVDVDKEMKKPAIQKAIKESENDDESIRIAWEVLQDAQKRELEQKKLELEREERLREHERQQQKHEKEMAEIQVEILKSRAAAGIEGDNLVRPSEVEPCRMDQWIKPYKMGEDIALFLVHFERTCERGKFSPSTWSQRLVTLLPCEAANVVARLSVSDAEDYGKVKATLLKRYRISSEAFRQRFRDASKKSNEDYSEFAYGLKTNLVEWLKGAEVYQSRDKIVECICLEQFYRSIPQAVRLWIQDRDGVDTVDKAALLADEYVMRRKLTTEDERSQGRDNQGGFIYPKKQKREKATERAEPAEKTQEGNHDNGVSNTPEGKQKKADAREFEKRRPYRCYNCQGLGHFAAECKKEKAVVLSYVNESEESFELLRPYLQELRINGKTCSVLRDSGATMDLVHPSFVSAEDYTGKVIWIKSVLEKHSVCLPIARVTVSGPFGDLETEAGVSKALSMNYPYLFSNHSERLLRDRGRQFGEKTVQAFTRSPARQIAAQLADETSIGARRKETHSQPEPNAAAEKAKSVIDEGERKLIPAEHRPRKAMAPVEITKKETGSILPPGSSSVVLPPLNVNRKHVSAVRKRDRTLTTSNYEAKECHSRRNVSIRKEGMEFIRVAILCVCIILVFLIIHSVSLNFLCNDNGMRTLSAFEEKWKAVWKGCSNFCVKIKNKDTVDFENVQVWRVKGQGPALAHGAALCCFVCLTHFVQDVGQGSHRTTVAASGLQASPPFFMASELCSPAIPNFRGEEELLDTNCAPLQHPAFRRICAAFPRTHGSVSHPQSDAFAPEPRWFVFHVHRPWDDGLAVMQHDARMHCISRRALLHARVQSTGNKALGPPLAESDATCLGMLIGRT